MFRQVIKSCRWKGGSKVLEELTNFFGQDWKISDFRAAAGGETPKLV